MRQLWLMLGLADFPDCVDGYQNLSLLIGWWPAQGLTEMRTRLVESEGRHPDHDDLRKIVPFFNPIAFLAMRSSSGPSLDGASDAHRDFALDPASPSPEAVARVSVSLPRSLYRQLRLHALDQDTTLSALLARLIHKELG